MDLEIQGERMRKKRNKAGIFGGARPDSKKAGVSHIRLISSLQ